MVKLSKGKTDQVLALGTRTSTRGRGGTVLDLLSLATTAVLLLGMMASISVALIVGAIIAVWLLCASALLRRADATAGSSLPSSRAAPRETRLRRKRRVA
jgi:hypothetical protein